MNSLQITHLPFHPRRNIYALMGICSLLLGRLSQALEFDRHLGEIEPPDESNYGSDYHVWFNCLKAERLEPHERVQYEYSRIADLMESRGNESRDVLLRLLLDWSMYADSRGETENARMILTKALGVCRQSGAHETETAWIAAKLAGAVPPSSIVFPPLEFDSEIVLQFVEQDSNLKRLQRKINELGFLQAWQDCLRQENKRDEIIHKCTNLLSRHFMVDEVDFFEILNQEEDSDDGEIRLCMVQGDPVDAHERARFLIERYREWGPKFGFWEDGESRRAGSYLPITYMGRTRCLLWVMGDRRSMSDEVHRVLVTAAWQMTAAMELLMLQDKLLKAATIDALTGLANRSEFLRRLDYYFKMAKRLGPIPKQEFCVLFMDLDNFKYVNDTWGHNAGDLMLKLFSETVGKILRSTDLVCRYGGDEFMALLPATDIEGATITAERILAGLRFKGGYAAEISRFLGEPVSFPAGKELSCSIGVTEYDSARDDRIETIIARADEGAYCAKKEGKGRYKVS
jgi:diguanylate cyclase (GGDEF)-like protein